MLRLRELDPEDAQINLVLARLTKQRDLPQAVRYYENAIYGRWTGTQIDERRRQVRVELIQLLLARHERDRALSELLILDGDLPQEANAHVQAGEMFLEAADAQHAVKNFQQAAKLDPQRIGREAREALSTSAIMRGPGVIWNRRWLSTANPRMPSSFFPDYRHFVG